MFEAAVKFQQRRKRFRENKRLIERQKLIYDPNKIVLSNDFFECAVFPAIENNTTFERLFGARGSLLGDTLNYFSQSRQIATFPVHYKSASPETQREVEEQIDHQVGNAIERQKQEVDTLLRAFLGHALPEKAQVVFAGPSEEELTARLQSQTHVPAFYLGNIMQAMDATAPPSLWTGEFGVKRYETASLFKDEGHLALAFWQNVNALRDFSGMFPDRPPPPRWGSPDDDGAKVGVKVGAGAWKPA
jgi:hypothetical protein